MTKAMIISLADVHAARNKAISNRKSRTITDRLADLPFGVLLAGLTLSGWGFVCVIGVIAWRLL